jgi:hypothetical protein
MKYNGVGNMGVFIREKVWLEIWPEPIRRWVTGWEWVQV